MRLKSLMVAAGVALALATGTAAAQDLKIAVVNIARLVAESPQAAAARASMEAQFTGRRAEIQAKQEALRANVERLQRDGAVMSEQAREELAETIRDQQRRLQLLQSEYNDDVTQAEQDLLEGLREDIRTVILAFADSEGYDLILGNGVLYANETVDVTEEVLERLADL